MQLRKTVMMLTALSALSLVMTGCPGDDTGGSTVCSADTDCLGTEICHPTAKVCVTTCTAGADCPDSAKTCAAVSTTDTRKVCQCSTDVLCNSDGGADLVCSNLDKVCAAKCTTDSACGTGRTCDTASGQCKAGGNTGTSCTGSSQATCSYGQFCSSSKCEAAPEAPATCENFSTNRPAWSSAASNGPVIYEASLLRFEANSVNCSAGDAFIARVRAYRTDADWPAARSGLSGFFYVNTAAGRTDIVDSGLLIANTGYNRSTTNLKDAEFQVALCRPAGSTTVQAGFFFTGGNPVCSQLTKP